MKQMKSVQLVVVFGMGLTLMSCGEGGDGMTNSALAQQDTGRDFVAPTVFQAAGPNIASIQNTIDQYRTALGATNNGNTPGPLSKDSGHREINWDGGGNNDTTTAPVTPFNTFLNTRGALFTTPGTGLSQAPPSGGPQGGLATLFNNPTYGTIFSTFSPLRLFTPVDSNVTEALFFVPGSNGTVPAKVSGFGAVFTDVDLPDGSGPGNKNGNRQSQHAASSASAPTGGCSSAALSQPRRAMEVFPSSASSFPTRASPECGSRAAMLPRGRMMMGRMTSS